ncbi:hypothetical protein KIW84_045047 [Lathyrus oleraceus]|uniref:ATPase AAA-type core domain-containing protein n=1 Tax=Pisum sativum TaxID=3888 RepID=A0A9D4XM52_PEA|nr:hypothetical protein KIW84_045047 [Pisum sativum]
MSIATLQVFLQYCTRNLFNDNTPARWTVVYSYNKQKEDYEDMVKIQKVDAEERKKMRALEAEIGWIEAGADDDTGGILLCGPLGVGKTLLAKLVAGEAGAPSIIFIDELDVVRRKCGLIKGSSGQERDITLNQLLVCLYGFKGMGEVITIASTNRLYILDRTLVISSLTASLRFDGALIVDVLETDSIQVEVLSYSNFDGDLMLSVRCGQSIMLAAKFMDDALFNNAYYAKVGRLSTSKLNRLELSFWFGIDFRLQVSVDTFGRYCLQLEKEGS